jgi:alanine racemase
VSVVLEVDAQRWHDHHDAMLSRVQGIVPVVKGNGYGFGRELLAGQCARLGVDAVAVGTDAEVASIRTSFDQDVLVLQPWRPDLAPATAADPRLIRTIAHLDAARALQGSGAPVVIEVLTSMHRHGLDEHALSQLRASDDVIDGLDVRGFALHLPIDQRALAGADEVTAAFDMLRRLGLTPDAGTGTGSGTVWVSHLSKDDAAVVRARHPDVTLRPRIGTHLWLGDPGCAVAIATVLDVHRIRQGDRVGYRQNRVTHDGHLLVVSGGTTHGIGLEAPKPMHGLLPRAKVVALGGLEAMGRVLSPFIVAGKHRWFAEPPHMQVSLVLLPNGVEPPAIGDQVEVTVRMTTANFDSVVLR